MKSWEIKPLIVTCVLVLIAIGSIVGYRIGSNTGVVGTPHSELSNSTEAQSTGTFADVLAVPGCSDMIAKLLSMAKNFGEQSTQGDFTVIGDKFQPIYQDIVKDETECLSH